MNMRFNKNLGQNVKRKINRNINNMNLHRFKYLRGFLKRTSIAFTLVLAILILKKINLSPSNYLLGLLDNGIRSEFQVLDKSKSLYSSARKLLSKSDRLLEVFSPVELERYPSPLEGSIERPYKKGENEGLVIKALDNDDEPKSIVDGEVINVELSNKTGYHVSIRKENLEIVYGYLAKSYVEIGDKLEIGQAIGSLGTNKDGNKYLRLELKIDGKIQDPSKYIDTK